MRRPGGWWRGKNTPQKVETYTRLSFQSFALIEVVSVVPPLLGELRSALGIALLALVVVHAGCGAAAVSRSLDWTRGRRLQPVRTLWTLTAVTAAVAVVGIGVAERGPDRESAESAALGVFGIVLVFGAGIIALGVRNRVRVFAIVAGFAAGAGVVAFPLGRPGPAALVSALVVLVGGGFIAFTSVFSVWLLNAVYELDEAREARARLAVAEERLRFGRDLHDVMGRNLAVIALKSELAVRLARRGRPEAVEQMIEVQRIAQESQREVRDVVRGYRETDLGVELRGARGVLRAAGIECEVSGEADRLPAEVQSALGWVVRETTTNVLRHGDARRCSVEVRRAERRVVLTVENDGAVASGREREVGQGDSGGGSGLPGLRERLREVGGTLEAGVAGAGLFRVVARVPVGGEGETAPDEEGTGAYGVTGDGGAAGVGREADGADGADGAAGMGREADGAEEGDTDGEAVKTNVAHAAARAGQAHEAAGTGQAHEAAGTGQAHEAAGTGQAHEASGTGQTLEAAGTGQAHEAAGADREVVA